MRLRGQGVFNRPAEITRFCLSGIGIACMQESCFQEALVEGPFRLTGRRTSIASVCSGAPIMAMLHFAWILYRRVRMSCFCMIRSQRDLITSSKRYRR